MVLIRTMITISTRKTLTCLIILGTMTSIKMVLATTHGMINSATTGNNGVKSSMVTMVMETLGTSMKMVTKNSMMLKATTGTRMLQKMSSISIMQATQCSIIMKPNSKSTGKNKQMEALTTTHGMIMVMKNMKALMVKTLGSGTNLRKNGLMMNTTQSHWQDLNHGMILADWLTHQDLTFSNTEETSINMSSMIQPVSKSIITLNSHGEMLHKIGI